MAVWRAGPTADTWVAEKAVKRAVETVVLRAA
jgi:hypothetical protein